MKTSSDELFNLIKSLSRHEKRDFKLFTGRDSAYICLFDALNDEEKYDEKKLLIDLKKRGIKNIKRIKSYLHKELFKFLEQKYAEDSIEIILQRLLQITEVLHKKGLVKAAEKNIRKAEGIALENHQYLYLLNILAWKRKLMMVELNNEEFQNDIKESDYIEIYKNITEYQKLYSRAVKVMLVQSDNLPEKTKKELNAILQHPLLKGESKALSYLAKFLYCRTLGTVFYLLENLEKSCYYFKKAVLYFEQSKSSPFERLAIYNMLINTLWFQKKTDEMLVIKDEVNKYMEKLPKKSMTPGLYRDYLPIINNYITFQGTMFHVKEAFAESNRVQKLMDKYAKVMTFVIYYYNRFQLCLYMMDYRGALQSSIKVLSLENTGVQHVKVQMMKLSQLVIHYELGNMDLLPGLCKSLSRDFDNQKQANVPENIVLDFFGKIIIKANNQREKTKAFSDLKRALEATSWGTEKIQNNVLFISWAESKIVNRPLLDIMKEKVLSP